MLVVSEFPAYSIWKLPVLIEVADDRGFTSRQRVHQGPRGLAHRGFSQVDYHVRREKCGEIINFVEITGESYVFPELARLDLCLEPFYFRRRFAREQQMHRIPLRE